MLMGASQPRVCHVPVHTNGPVVFPVAIGRGIGKDLRSEPASKQHERRVIGCAVSIGLAPRSQIW